MKRSIDGISGGSVHPGSKRSVGEENVDGDNNESSAISNYTLKTKSRNLTLELMRNKRELVEARKELDLMRKKSQEMEALVSLIQRSWSQIDIDSSLLLDSLGDSDVKLPEEVDSELLHKLLSASSRWLLLDPTNTSHVSQLDIDQWSSKTDIEKAKDAALQKESDVKLLVKSPHEGGPEAKALILLPEQVEHHLRGHTSFTMSLLERLCASLNDISDIGNREDILRPLTQAREHSSIILSLQDNILKLRSEIVETKALLQLKENEKIKLEKKLDKTMATMKELEERGVALRNNNNSNSNIDTATTSATALASSVFGNQVSGGEGQTYTNNTSNSEVNNNNNEAQVRAYEKELQEQIDLLENQLAESESAKAKVERQMTEKLAKPFAQTETQVSDMRKTLEELKTQFKHRLADYVKQIETITKERDDYHFVVTQLESVTAAKVAAVVTATEQEITKIKTEKQALENRISAMQAHADIAQQLKTQVQEWSQVDSARQARISHLEKDLVHWQQVLAQTNEHLLHAKKREEILEKVIVTFAVPLPSDFTLHPIHNSNINNSNSTSSDSINSGDTVAVAAVTGTGDINPTNNSHPLLITQAHERCQELEKELQDTKASIHDFLTEIDAVSNQETASRQQSERLLQQIHDYQSIQRDALQENMCLQTAVEDMKKTMKELEQRTEMMKVLMLQQESTLTDIRQVEQTTRQEWQSLKSEYQKLQQEKDILTITWQEAVQRVKELENEYAKTMKRNQELHTRCDELTQQAEMERKKRYDESRLHAKKERQHQKKIAQLEGSTTANSLLQGAKNRNGNKGQGNSSSSDQQDMLDMTLEMLRCSVCHDRFKNVTITRCFHMFCRECIEENLRNRSRKCPACGEKFGQDDVAQVYFTH